MGFLAGRTLWLLLCLFIYTSATQARSVTQAQHAPAKDTQPVIFVGNNWEGMIDVIDAATYRNLGRINGIPDKQERMREIHRNLFRTIFFYVNRYLPGEGNDQYVDDMYSTKDGRLLIVSRPSFGDVAAIDLQSNDIVWRFRVAGFRSDHMAISPDGKEVAVSASTGNVVHILNTETGEERGRFESGNSPHENIYSDDGKRIFHASIGFVFTPWDADTQDSFKGKRIFKIVDAETLEDIKSFDLKPKLKAAGLGHLSPAIRPMTFTSDERFFYFQLSFLHGFIEYDMQQDKVTRLMALPNHIPEVPITEYVNDSAHHGIALSGDQSTFCVAGTMDDYVALVDRQSFEHTVLTGLGGKPYWVTNDVSGERCYISWSETDQMSVISYQEAAEIARVNVGRHPQRIREGVIPDNWLLADE